MEKWVIWQKKGKITGCIIRAYRERKEAKEEIGKGMNHEL
jgi:hypothetical protein